MLNPCSRGRCLFSVLLVCLAVLPAAAQSDSPVHIVPREKTPSPAPILAAEGMLIPHTRPLRADVNVVLVPVTVTDEKSRPVLGLDKDDFLLYDGEKRQHIRYFSSEDAPISIGILLDLSNSMKNKIDVAREALGEFFKTANPEDDYFVITFANRPELVADTTQSIGTIQAKLGEAIPAGRTSLLDAIYLGLNKARHSRYHRRALLIISDGGDNCSRYRSREIKSLVQESDVEIYALGIFDSIFRTPEEWAGKKLLNAITEATGGHLVTVGNPRDLPEMAAAISLELRSTYMLGYEPAENDGKWHKLKVRLSPSAQMPTYAQVYSKRGYQAPK